MGRSICTLCFWPSCWWGEGQDHCVRLYRMYSVPAGQSPDGSWMHSWSTVRLYSTKCTLATTTTMLTRGHWVRTCRMTINTVPSVLYSTARNKWCQTCFNLVCKYRTSIQPLRESIWGKRFLMLGFVLILVDALWQLLA